MGPFKYLEYRVFELYSSIPETLKSSSLRWGLFKIYIKYIVLFCKVLSLLKIYANFLGLGWGFLNEIRSREGAYYIRYGKYFIGNFLLQHSETTVEKTVDELPDEEVEEEILEEDENNNVSTVSIS